VTGPRRRDRDADASTDVPRERPPRPAAVVVAAAFLIVDGLLSVVMSLDVFGRLLDGIGALEPLALLSVAIGFATVLLGVLVHFGRAWLLTLNVAAIAGFLELTAGTPAGLLTGAVDVLVVVILLWARPWFAWSPRPDGNGGAPEEEGAAVDERAPSP
jgi:hypothetical protein